VQAREPVVQAQELIDQRKARNDEMRFRSSLTAELEWSKAGAYTLPIFGSN